MLIAMGLAFVLGLFILFIYKKTFNGVMYSSGFGISLVAMSLVTTMIILAIFGSVFIGVVLYIFSSKKPTDKPYILIVDCADETAEGSVNALLKRTVKKSLLKSKTVTKTGLELTIEVRLPDQESGFVNKISDLAGVSNAVLVSYNGEYMT